MGFSCKEQTSRRCAHKERADECQDSWQPKSSRRIAVPQQRHDLTQRAADGHFRLCVSLSLSLCISVCLSLSLSLSLCLSVSLSLSVRHCLSLSNYLCLCARSGKDCSGSKSKAKIIRNSCGCNQSGGQNANQEQALCVCVERTLMLHP